ncbi:MAG: 50S ribosomal protein L5 [bacterium]|nr:50S ribosomal protein L5 [bacterium]
MAPKELHLKDIYKEKTLPLFQKEHDYKNIMSVPRIKKVIVNMGIGRLKDDKEQDTARQALELITGQKVQIRPARISIASFKLRKGMPVGFRVTLRGKRMYEFLEKLIFSAIPRMRDFRGFEDNIIDEHGNLHIGIREHIIFPEMVGEDVNRIFGFQVSIVTSAGTKEKADALFRSLHFPLAKK